MLQLAAPVQKRPEQQRWPEPPHASQVLLPQVSPAEQKSPLRPAQQGSLSPPQATQVLFASTVDGAVQSTPCGHRCWPGSPHWPPLQPPPAHVPWPCEQAEPLATQTLELLSQQPPPPHWLPSQQGEPGVPHCRQMVFPPHAMPVATQKSGALLLLPAAQHMAPAPPQPPQAPPAQVPSPPPQVPPLSTQVSLTQHAPAPAHVLLSQQGCPAPPQATKVPARQTLLPVPLSPLGTH